MIDNSILDFLNLFDDDYIISLSNKGYLKRAKKDLEKLRDEIKIINEAPPEIKIQDNTVTIKDTKVEDITCTCPDSKFCRHRIVAIFYVKEKYSANLPDGSQSGNDNTENKISENKNSDEKYKELLNFDLKSLEKKFTKVKFMKGVKYFLGSEITSELSAGALTFIFKNDFSKEEIKFAFRAIRPLENNNCNNISCKGKKDCEHHVASMLYYLTDKEIIKKESIAELVKKDLKPIDEKLLKEVEDVFLEIIKLGLTRMTFAVALKIKKLAFRIHYEIPTFEKLMNGVERDLNSFISKNPKFDLESFRNKIVKFFRILRLYRANPMDYKMIDILTRHRSEYFDIKEIVLYGVGKEYIEAGDNAILKTYFMSSDNKVFTRSLFVSLKSDSDYSNPRNKLHFMPLWEGYTTDAFLNRKVIIKKTKINSERVISSIVFSVAVKDTHNFKNLKTYEDFSIFKNEYLQFRKENTLLSINYTPFYSLIKPSGYSEPVFDYETQAVSIEIFDENGNSVTLKFRYGDVPKRYQNDRKKVFDRIISEFANNREKPLIIFGKPYIDNKVLYINVISFYYENQHKIVNPDIDWEKDVKLK